MLLNPRPNSSPAPWSIHHPDALAPQAGPRLATFGAGCFWSVEVAFRAVPGVVDAAVGYAGGHELYPSYEQVCSAATGHAEVVQVAFDPAIVSYDTLLQVFWGVHDPTQRNRQGHDVGPQYRSVVFAHDHGQRALAEASRRRLVAGGVPVATVIEDATTFWRAEEYHQQYLARRGRAACSA